MAHRQPRERNLSRYSWMQRYSFMKAIKIGYLICFMYVTKFFIASGIWIVFRNSKSCVINRISDLPSRYKRNYLKIGLLPKDLSQKGAFILMQRKCLRLKPDSGSSRFGWHISCILIFYQFCSMQIAKWMRNVWEKGIGLWTRLL